MKNGLHSAPLYLAFFSRVGFSPKGEEAASGSVMLLCELLGQNQGSWLAEESMGLARWELGWGQPEHRVLRGKFLLGLRIRSVGMGRKLLGCFTGVGGSI